MIDYALPIFIGMLIGAAISFPLALLISREKRRCPVQGGDIFGFDDEPHFHRCRCCCRTWAHSPRQVASLGVDKAHTCPNCGRKDPLRIYPSVAEAAAIIQRTEHVD